MIRDLPDCIEQLAPHHDRRGFCCGEPDLDDYLRRFARQHATNKISRTYVAADGKRILGFYSLAMSAIRKDQFERLPDAPLTLWLPTSAIVAL